jgi:5-methylcytosine-specific restriction protein A
MPHGMPWGSGAVYKDATEIETGWRVMIKKPCGKIGCRELVNRKDRYCEEHRLSEQRRYDKDRGTATQRGYNSRWARYSREYRARNPLCVKCQEQGKVTPAQHVDHITPTKGKDDPLHWEPSNHQSVCISCHNAKTRKDEMGHG